MKKLDKQLKKFSSKEREEVEHLVKRILDRDLARLDCKKLKGFRNLFRVRRGKIRVIFELVDGKDPNIITIERRTENTYKF